MKALKALAGEPMRVTTSTLSPGAAFSTWRGVGSTSVQTSHVTGLSQPLRSVTTCVKPNGSMRVPAVTCVHTPGPLAGAAGLRVTPHSPKHNPELATLLHFASVVRHTGPFLEFPARPVSYDDWYSPKFTIEPGGFIKLPAGPGLGVSYDEAIWQEAQLI